MTTQIKFIRLPAGFGCEAFEMSETPITEAQWADVMGAEAPTHPNHPQVNISATEAEAFCARLSERLGRDVRLPTEFEFCRALGEEPENLEEFAVFERDNICDVATKKPNEYGLYDMRGLVWELLRRVRDGKYVLRGGSWYNNRERARAVSRSLFNPNHRSDLIGFRVVVVGRASKGK